MRGDLSENRAVKPSAVAAVCAVGALALMLLVVLGRRLAGAAMVDDDAYYYMVIARHIAASGVSTFDGQSLTNGYHPLWLALLVLQDLSLGPSIPVTLTMAAALIAGGLYGFLRCAPAAPPILMVVLSLVTVALGVHFALGGMESALFVFCLGLLVNALLWARRRSVWRAGVLGLAAAVCAGARIDSAVFVVPALLMAPLSRQTRVLALMVVALLGGAYVVINLAAFHMAMPVSSTVKSLGGLQLNLRALGQLGLGPTPRPFSLQFGCTVVALLGSLIILPLSRPGSLGRTLAWASALGGGVFLGRLFFLSSWMVWPWYDFALFFPLLAAYYAGADRLARSWLLTGKAAAVAGVALYAVSAGLALGVQMQRRTNHFDFINHLAIQRYAPLLGGARIAMGDRAGSLAWAYPGSVLQLEGLVNDKGYLAAISRPGDLRPLLCARGVRYLLDYQNDLGAYDHLRVPAMRPFLTQFQGPEIEVWRTDEVGHVSDPSLYDNRTQAETGNSTLYIWRLRCPAPG
jgi:hypothetical protein